MTTLTSTDALLSSAVKAASKASGASTDRIIAAQYPPITYLAVVLVIGANESVCWIYNAAIDGLSTGHYGSQAIDSFKARQGAK